MSEPWIRVHANLAAKPVVWRAAEALGVSQNEAVGLLVRLWGAVSLYGENGQLAGLPDAQIESWAGWRGKKGRFATFIRSHHLDADGRVNEWDEYAGALETRRRKDRDRKRTSRGQSAGHPQDCPPDGGGGSAPARAKRDETTTTTTTNYFDPPATREARETPSGTAPDGAVIGEPALTALYLVVWANGAITERWGEQPSPLTRGTHATQLADDLRAAGVEWETARLSIYDQCRRSKNPRPPRTVNYFRDGILEAWQRETARREMAAAGDTAPSPGLDDSNVFIATAARMAAQEAAHG